MKRSEAIIKLIPKVICPHVIISQEQQEMWRHKADELLKFIEEDLGMLPPRTKIHGTQFSDNCWEKE